MKFRLEVIIPPGLCITLAPKKLIRTRRASEGSASEPSLARRVSMCKDAKLSCRGNMIGAVFADQVKSLDWRARRADLIGRLPAAVIDDVLVKVRTLL